MRGLEDFHPSINTLQVIKGEKDDLLLNKNIRTQHRIGLCVPTTQRRSFTLPSITRIQPGIQIHIWLQGSGQQKLGSRLWITEATEKVVGEHFRS